MIDTNYGYDIRSVHVVNGGILVLTENNTLWLLYPDQKKWQQLPLLPFQETEEE